MFSLFYWLHELKRTSIVIPSYDNRLFIEVIKKEDEVITLDLDFSSLEEKFYNWHFSKDPVFYLDAVETGIFVEICHAAYYYLGKQDYDIGSSRNKIISLYEAVFDGWK